MAYTTVVKSTKATAKAQYSSEGKTKTQSITLSGLANNPNADKLMAVVGLIQPVLKTGRTITATELTVVSTLESM